MLDLTNAIIEYESGQLGEDEVISLFQRLLDSGLCWQLQGSYGRMAVALIEAGLITWGGEALARDLEGHDGQD